MHFLELCYIIIRSDPETAISVSDLDRNTSCVCVHSGSTLKVSSTTLASRHVWKEALDVHSVGYTQVQKLSNFFLFFFLFSSIFS